MEKVFEVCGYQFTIITPSPSVLVFSGNKSEPHFIAQEVADALGYAKTYTLTQQMDDVIKLTNSNGLGFLIEIIDAGIKKGQASTIWDGKDLDKISQLSLIPESSLLKHLLKSATKPKAKVVSEKLYLALSQVKTLVEVFEEPKNPLLDLLNSEAERLGLSKEFLSWYFERVVKSRYLRSWNRRERKYNWLMNQSLGFHFSFHWR